MLTDDQRAVLLACAPQAESVALVRDDQWNRVYAQARSHKLGSLVLSRWKAAVGGLPAGAERNLLLGAARNMLMCARLLAILDGLRGEGIEVLPFKGPLLAVRLFGALHRRDFRDLDILVPRDCLARSCHLLIEQGYAPLLDLDIETYLRAVTVSGHHVVMRHRVDGVYVEVHWELSGRYLPVALDFDVVRPFLEEFAWEGREVWDLNSEAKLVYLCVHGAREYWRILDLVACIAWQMERDPPDWTSTLELATRWGALNILLIGVALASYLFGLELPQSVEALLDRCRGSRREARRREQSMFNADRPTRFRLWTAGELLRMHWRHFDDPVHFWRWIAFRLMAPAPEDLTSPGLLDRTRVPIWARGMSGSLKRISGR